VSEGPSLEAGPIGYREIVPQETLVVNEATGEIERSYTPDRIAFKDGDKIRPVAPFLEVFARLEGEEGFAPLTLEILDREGLAPSDVVWTLDVANIKIYRRTGDVKDKIDATVEIRDHEAHPVLGECPNFYEGKRLPLGSARYIKPTWAFPEVRLRYTPGAGYVYGASKKRHTSDAAEVDDPIITSDDRVLYDPSKGKWRGFPETSSYNPAYTNPAQIFAGYDKDNGDHVSWGYFDDECDGIASVKLTRKDGTTLEAFARIGAGPPAFAPDTLPIRTVADDLTQALLGVEALDDVPIEEAEEIVRKAFETVRLMNTAVMNGNPTDGRLNVASTMVRQDTNDFGRRFEPIMATPIVDNLAILALHQRVFTALRAGAAPWFYEALRQPEEIGDLSDDGRRKMPALMRGADGRALTLTRRQIDTIKKAASRAMFDAPSAAAGPGGPKRGDEK
jgi:hypothetical protein